MEGTEIFRIEKGATTIGKEFDQSIVHGGIRLPRIEVDVSSDLLFKLCFLDLLIRLKGFLVQLHLPTDAAVIRADSADAGKLLIGIGHHGFRTHGFPHRISTN